jgi:diketogulonate reductase-like aldo/keto reductase
MIIPLVQTSKHKNAEGNLTALDFTIGEAEMDAISPLTASNTNLQN